MVSEKVCDCYVMDRKIQCQITPTISAYGISNQVYILVESFLKQNFKTCPVVVQIEFLQMASQTSLRGQGRVRARRGGCTPSVRGVSTRSALGRTNSARESATSDHQQTPEMASGAGMVPMAVYQRDMALMQQQLNNILGHLEDRNSPRPQDRVPNGVEEGARAGREIPVA